MQPPPWVSSSYTTNFDGFVATCTHTDKAVGHDVARAAGGRPASRPRSQE